MRSHTAAVEIDFNKILCQPDLHLSADQIKLHRILVETITYKIIVFDYLLFPDRRLICSTNSYTADGKFSVADVVALQKWLLCAERGESIEEWKAGNFVEDDTPDGFYLGS